MTQHEFKRECHEATKEFGFRKGARVLVNGRIGTVTTKLMRGPDNILQAVKFDEPDENGKHFGSFPHTDLTEATEARSEGNEVDQLRAALAGKPHTNASTKFNGGTVRRT